MREEYRINPKTSLWDVRTLIGLVNESFRKISMRLDKMDGTRGTPTFSGQVNMNGNRLVSLSNPASPTDAINQNWADNRYVMQNSSFVKSIVTSPVSNQAIDSGMVIFTGSGSVSARLASILSAGAWLAQDASSEIYPGVTVSVSGTVLTFKTWKQSSSSNPTPVASTASATVYWMAIGALP